MWWCWCCWWSRPGDVVEGWGGCCAVQRVTVRPCRHEIPVRFPQPVSHSLIVLPVLIHLDWFTWIDPPALIHLYWFTCIGSPVLIHLDWFTCIGSPGLIHLHWFTCIDSPALIHLYWFTCIGSPVLIHLYWFTCIDSPGWFLSAVVKVGLAEEVEYHFCASLSPFSHPPSALLFLPPLLFILLFSHSWHVTKPRLLSSRGHSCGNNNQLQTAGLLQEYNL